jgi:hypothetical protein
VVVMDCSLGITSVQEIDPDPGVFNNLKQGAPPFYAIAISVSTFDLVFMFQQVVSHHAYISQLCSFCR